MLGGAVNHRKSVPPTVSAITGNFANAQEVAESDAKKVRSHIIFLLNLPTSEFYLGTVKTHKCL